MQYLSDRLRVAKVARDPGGSRSQKSDVAAQQRERLLEATSALVAERGLAGATIERIAKRSHVSSATFYVHFASREEVVVAAFDQAVDECASLLAAEVSSDQPWPNQVRAGLSALLAAIAAEPDRARFCLVEAPKGGPLLLDRYEAMLDRAVPKLHEGRLRGFTDRDLPAALEEATAAGIAWLLRERLEDRGSEAVDGLLDELVELVLGPHPGPLVGGG